MEKLKISIVTAYPTQGAGSGTLITAQAKTYVEMGHEVHIVTANNNTSFNKLDGVTYHLVPFTGEKEPIEKLEGDCLLTSLCLHRTLTALKIFGILQMSN